jgi:Domain of unknown function (DUF397)
VRRVGIQWHKSSFSTDSVNCLELASHQGDVLIRESEDADVIVRTTTEKLRAFLTNAKAGEFSELT